MSDDRLGLIQEYIRDVPDFPKEGILFKDITPVLSNPKAFRNCIELFAEHHKSDRLDHIVAIESRGFIFGAPLALELDVPLTIVRKPGKLPWKTHEVSYDLEYGSATLQIHQDALKPGDRCLVIDDLLATGGTAAAACTLVNQLEAEVVCCSFVIELGFLRGAEKISAPTFSLLSF